MSALIPVALIIAMLLLNAIFVAAEFAMVVANRQKLEGEAHAGDLTATRIVRILSNRRLQDRYIATAQLGITLASLGLGMYGEHQLSKWLYAAANAPGIPAWLGSHALASFIAVTVLTYLHIVFGEMTPKTLALTNAERSARALVGFMAATEIVARPLVAVLNGMGNGLLKSLRISAKAEALEQHHSAEEIQYLVRESGQSGLITPQAAEVIEELIEFGQLTAGEVMLPRVRIEGVELGSPVEELRRLVQDEPHTRYPVYVRDLDHIIGTIHIKTVLRRVLQGTGIAQSDIKPVPFVPETSTLNKVLHALRMQRSQIAVVMDEHGGTAGIVSISDLFEEIVGEIEDASPGSSPEISLQPDGTWLVHGTARVDDVSESIGRSIGRDDVDSISGLVLALLDRPPVPGDVVEVNGVTIEVVHVEGHGVEVCQIRISSDNLGPGA